MDIFNKLMTRKLGWTPVEMARTSNQRKKMKRYCRKVAKQKIKQTVGVHTDE